MPEKRTKVKLALKNLSKLPSYFDYIFVHLRQKVRLRPEYKPEIFVNFRPEPDPKSPARLTTLPEPIHHFPRTAALPKKPYSWNSTRIPEYVALQIALKQHFRPLHHATS